MTNAVCLSLYARFGSLASPTVTSAARVWSLIAFPERTSMIWQDIGLGGLLDKASIGITMGDAAIHTLQDMN